MLHGLGLRWMGVLFAVLISITFGFAFNSVQSNTICAAWEGAFAQNLEIKGMVRDARNKEILEFANVVLQTMDSSFVAGTTTDMKGHFLLNKIKKGSYILSVSSLGFKTEYISLESLSKNISLGEISLNDDAVSLDGVTVSASAQTSHADKKVVFPSERQMKASGNGMDLLQQMMLPRVQVDLLNSEIKATGNGIVQVRINGVKVEQDEIKALNPSDIIRIEYHDNPGLRYGNADIVLDYIVRRPDTGGSFGLDMAQGINSMWGEHNAWGRSIIRTRNGALLIGSVLVISME